MRHAQPASLCPGCYRSADQGYSRSPSSLTRRPLFIQRLFLIFGPLAIVAISSNMSLLSWAMAFKNVLVLAFLRAPTHIYHSRSHFLTSHIMSTHFHPVHSGKFVFLVVYVRIAFHPKMTLGLKHLETSRLYSNQVPQSSISTPDDCSKYHTIEISPPLFPHASLRHTGDMDLSRTRTLLHICDVGPTNAIPARF